MSNYRDPLASALAILDARRGRVAARLGLLRAAHRVVIVDADREVLDGAQRTLAEAPATLEDIARANRQLDAIEQAIDRADAALSVADDGGIESTGETLDGVGQWLQAVVRPWNGIATQESGRWIAHAYVGEVGVEAEVFVTETVERAVSRLEMVTTSVVPRTIAPIMIGPQTGFQTFAKRFHLLSEHETGVREVDDAYWISADDDVAKVILTDDVVHALATMAEHRASLTVANGAARLRWTPRGDVHGALVEPMLPTSPREATEKLVPRAAFEIHTAIRRALDPAVEFTIPIVVERPPMPAPRPRIEPPPPAESPRVAQLRELFRGYAHALATHQQSDWGVPDPSIEADIPIQALGAEDLPEIDQLTSDPDPHVATWAAARARQLRAEPLRDNVAAQRARGVSVAKFLLDDDTTEVERAAVVSLLQNDRDTAYVAKLTVDLLSNDGGARFARVFGHERLYNRHAIYAAVGALLHHSSTDAIQALLALPPPIGVDAALAIAWKVPTSPIADTLARRFHTMSTERRRAIALQLTSAYPPVALGVIRRFLDDDDGAVRVAAVTVFHSSASPEDTPKLTELLRSDPDPRVRQWAARALERAGAVALASLRAAYAADPHVRAEAMGAIVGIRRVAERKVQEPTAALERALADETVEDVVLFAHEMMNAGGADGDERLLAALRHPRAAAFGDHIWFRLAPTVAVRELPAALATEKEEFVLWLLDAAARGAPFPRAVFEHVAAQAPSQRLRDAAAQRLRSATPAQSLGLELLRVGYGD